MLTLSHDSIFCNYLALQENGKNQLRRSRDFSFLLNGKTVDGYSGWTVVSCRPAVIPEPAKGATMVLQGKGDHDGIRIEINYVMYPRLPVIRKWICFTNTGNEEVRIESLNTEDLQTGLNPTHTQVLHNYGRMKHLGTYTGNWDDPVVVLHQFREMRGLALGNEAPGILKRTAYHTGDMNAETGLTHVGQDYPFRKWLEPGESWTAPKTFICPYAGTRNGYDVINGDVNRFVTLHMKPRIVEIGKKPTFVYNTWNPFRTFVSDSLVRDLARAAARCGIKEFIIDDGWQVNKGGSTSKEAWGNNYGDWQVDGEKFAGGLKPTFDYIRSLGMKPGLWISIGAATEDAEVFQKHPEWFVKNPDQEPGNLHFVAENSNFYSSCYGTGWKEYIRDRILSLVERNGLAYTKLDFSVVTSAYVNDPAISGCYAKDHPYHKDHEESFIVIYERLLELFDELHREAPELFIDCTFETAGRLQLMDYAIARHAEGNWLANFETPSPTGALRVRHMAWWRTPAVPASSLVIGNQMMDDPEFLFSLKSLIGTLPIVLGDPRAVDPEKQVLIRRWSDWMQEMQDTYDYMSYRQDLPGFGEPREGAWDGWMRINFKTRQGGIIGVFRQGALEDTRRVFVKELLRDAMYAVRKAPEGTWVLRASGAELMKKGFEVKAEKMYEGLLYEIGLIKE